MDRVRCPFTGDYCGNDCALWDNGSDGCRLDEGVELLSILLGRTLKKRKEGGCPPGIESGLVSTETLDKLLEGSRDLMPDDLERIGKADFLGIETDWWENDPIPHPSGMYVIFSEPGRILALHASVGELNAWNGKFFVDFCETEVEQ